MPRPLRQMLTHTRDRRPQRRRRGTESEPVRTQLTELCRGRDNDLGPIGLHRLQLSPPTCPNQAWVHHVQPDASSHHVRVPVYSPEGAHPPCPAPPPTVRPLRRRPTRVNGVFCPSAPVSPAPGPPP